MPILQRLSTLVHRAQGNQLPNQSCPSFPYKLTVTIPYHTYHTPTSHIHYHKPNIVGIHTAHVTNKNKQKKTENMKTRARDCDRKKKQTKNKKTSARDCDWKKQTQKKKTRARGCHWKKKQTRKKKRTRAGDCDWKQKEAKKKNSAGPVGMRKKAPR